MKRNVKYSLLYCLFFCFESDISEPIRDANQLIVESSMRDEAQLLGISSIAQKEKGQTSDNRARHTNECSTSTSIIEDDGYLCVRNQWRKFLFASTEEATATSGIPGIDARLYSGLATWNAKTTTINSSKKNGSCNVRPRNVESHEGTVIRNEPVRNWERTADRGARRELISQEEN
ncbi:hypothetical protein M514_14195 [Trichuris suis]|uniref:Uncharacterized protein n=1 Tax=Trichuris suis TaxID=68888 RepID=A0A085LIY2_9BILA|nr:hypothetical protein M513_14195 [Trichuris suis]KFD64712.1 hypothetical protein M514_14195 [Trichuris suis]